MVKLNPLKIGCVVLWMTTQIGVLCWMRCTQKSPVDPTHSLQDEVPLLTNISASPSQIAVGGAQAEIRVRLVNQNGNALTNQVVQFSTNLGTVISHDSTDANGWASTILTSGTEAGQATVKASYGKLASSSISIKFISALEAQIQIQSMRSAILANGIDTTSVVVTVLGDSAQPVAGETVTFTSTVGKVASTAVTDNEGKAWVVLTSIASSRDTTATVTATHNSTSVAALVLLKGVQLLLTADPSEILADGKNKSIITVVLKETSSTIAIPEASVRFGTSLGTIPAETRTNIEGVARVELTSSTTTGIAQVTVRYGNLISATTQVVFRESIPTYLTVSATPPVIPGDGKSQSVIKATVSDATQNPVPDGTVVMFSLFGSGTIVSQKMTVGGIATSTLTSGASPDTVQVVVNVASLSDTIEVIYTIGEANQILVTSNKDTLLADGVDNATILARVLDAQGNPIQGLTVNFGATIGDITPSSETNTQGIAQAKFSSGIVGVSTITATVQLSEGKKVVGSKIIRLIPGGPNAILLRFDPQAIGVRETGQNQTAIIEAEVWDGKNNPVLDGTNVRFSIIHGPGGGEYINPVGPVPTVGGISRASISSGTISGNVRIKAEVLDEYENVIIATASEILIHAGPPYMENRNDYTSTHLTVRPEKFNIWRSIGTTTLTVAVFDKYHNPVQKNTAVYLTTSGGGVSTHTAYTDDQGKATVILTGANPQPLIYKYYYGLLMQDPNDATKILPGPVYYSALGEWLLPNFDGDYTFGYPATLNGWVINSMQDSIAACPRYHNADNLYVALENDGIARIMAYTEGMDAAGQPVRAWDQTTVVFSGEVRYSDNSKAVLGGQTLYLGESSTVQFSLMDDNGNPIQSGSIIKAELVPGSVDADISWETYNTGDGPGQSYYDITVSNAIDPYALETPKPGWVSIRISWENEYQFGDAITAQVFISAATRP